MIEWIEKGKNAGTEKDVRIGSTVIAGNEYTTINFHNQNYKKFGFDHVMVGLSGNKMFFKGTRDEDKGYKICVGTYTGVIKVKKKDLPFEEGLYDLYFDDEIGAYYIES